MIVNWINIEIGKILNVSRGGSPRPIKTFLTKQLDGINWIKIGDTKENTKYIQATAEKIKPSGISKTRLVKRGDLLLSNSMSYGRPYILKIDGAIHDGWLVISNKDNINVEKDFLFYVLSSPIVFTQFEQLAKGSTVKNLNTGIVERVKIPYFPLPEQRTIVSKIEELFSELDNGIANLKAAKNKLEIYRQAVLKKAFEGKLSEQDGKGLNDGQDENENNNHVHPVNLSKSCSDNGRLPNGWKWVKLGEVCDINPKIENKKTYSEELDVQFVPMKLVDAIIDKIHLSEVRKFKEVNKGSYTYFEEGDVIFAKVTPCMENGKIAVAKNLVNKIGFGSSEFHVLRCSPVLLNQYLFFYVVQSKFRNQAQHAMTGAVGLRRVPKKFIEDYYFPLPPTIAEQQSIVSAIESRLSVCDKLAESIDQGLEKAEALRQSILKKAFEGKLLSESELEACRKEPDWEPAERLLERLNTIKKIK